MIIYIFVAVVDFVECSVVISSVDVVCAVTFIVVCVFVWFEYGVWCR